MPATIDNLTDRVLEDVGASVGELVRRYEIQGWLNIGVGRLPALYRLSTSFSWLANDGSIVLPSDFVKLDRLTVSTGRLPAHTIWGGSLVFYDPATAAGSGTLFYCGYFPGVSASVASSLPPAGEDAIVSYALFRFYRKLASSRADFRRYTAITGQAGLEVADLDAVSERYRQDFLDARADLEEIELSEPTGFYGE